MFVHEIFWPYIIAVIIGREDVVSIGNLKFIIGNEIHQKDLTYEQFLIRGFHKLVKIEGFVKACLEIVSKYSEKKM